MLKKKKSYEKKIWYSKEKIVKPEASEKLRKIREDNIKKITEIPKFKDTLVKHKKGVLFKKRDPNKNNKYK